MSHDTGRRGAGSEHREGSGREGMSGMQEALGGIMERHRDVNVGSVERVLCVAGGGLLAVLGAARGGLSGLGLAALGGGLLYRGATGHCEAYHALGIDTSDSAEPSRASDLGRAHS
ncbi:DUF2892 domain-containing protein [Paludisphaera sp.]|uniref:YgaP family membrane protein n=1 Tax=Paludisphaera sp. TaxID=2017432 RepID=UPI00301C7064